MFSSCFLVFCVLSGWLDLRSRPRLLPESRRRPDPPALSRAHRPAHRRNRAPRRPDRRRHPPNHSRRTNCKRFSTTSACRTAASISSYSNSGTFGTSDGEILVQLKRKARADRRLHQRNARATCRSSFPGVQFFFQPADIVTQILNFGSPAPIDVAITGVNHQRELRDRAETRRRDAPHSRRRRRARTASASTNPRCTWTSTARARNPSACRPATSPKTCSSR